MLDFAPFFLGADLGSTGAAGLFLDELSFLWGICDPFGCVRAALGVFKTPTKTADAWAGFMDAGVDVAA